MPQWQSMCEWRLNNHKDVKVCSKLGKCRKMKLKFSIILYVVKKKNIILDIDC